MLINTPALVGFIFWLVIGLLVGATYSNHKSLTLEKFISIIIVVLYLIMILYWRFVDSQEIPVSFDVLGAGAAAHLIGLGVWEELKKYILSPKNK